VLPSAVNEGSHCFSSLSSLHTVSLFNFSYSGGWKVISHGFNLDLYVIDKVGNFIFYFKTSTQFSIRPSAFFLLIYRDSLHIMVSPLQLYVLPNLFPFCDLPLFKFFFILFLISIHQYEGISLWQFNRCVQCTLSKFAPPLYFHTPPPPFFKQCLLGLKVLSP
jgi:hypothetical protein